MKENIFEIVEKTIKLNDKYVSEDGKLLKTKVYSDIMVMDKDLIKSLMSNEKIMQTFFSNIDGNYVFDKQKFVWFIESNEFLPDSYTKYSNKLGLSWGNKFLENINDVVLDFPYKDCVLEGGQSEEESKRNEIFYNEIIGYDQITNMLSPKVLCNAKRYTICGEENNILFNENDNLIIKGNNLIGISSLLKKYEGKIKLIYIDPPYNTNTDSFKYNDSFNHSTWLTFMKTRLEIAKKLLSEDGSIYVQIDNKEAHYLKILMDEVFGRNNFRSEIIWDTSVPYVAGNKWLSNNWIYSYASIFYYAKNKDKVYFNKLTFDVHQKSGDISHKPYKDVWNDITQDIEFTEDYEKNKKEFGEMVSTIAKSNCSDVWCDIENFAGFLGAKDIKISFNSRKPEKLIERILEASTKEGDLILDFFGGSGTTLAVAHKMKRHYIGIEQMNNQVDIIVDRLKKVISGEDQKGITKHTGWEKGGSFVYCELKENSQKLISIIQNSTNSNINNVKKEIYNDNRIVPYITKKELIEVDSLFEELSLEDKKKALMSLVDKNKLYINYFDIEDEDFNLSDFDKQFTISFYDGERNE